MWKLFTWFRDTSIFVNKVHPIKENNSQLRAFAFKSISRSEEHPSNESMVPPAQIPIGHFRNVAKANRESSMEKQQHITGEFVAQERNSGKLGEPC
jgi:hypothetical protein